MYYDELIENAVEFDAGARVLSDFKGNDKHYFSGRRTMPGSTNPVKYEYYGTPVTPGAMIRHAITGERYRDRLVGTSAEDLFFKVRMPGFVPGSEALTLYYLSPEEFERQNQEELSTDIKSAWDDKYLCAKMEYSKKK